jgi:hypothetical protein
VSRLYTLETANRALPYVRAVVKEIRERYAHIQDLSDRHDSVPMADENARNALREDIRVDANRLQECTEELRALDVDLKDYESGLVDFPAELEGRRILLCWRYGEKEVAWWHELEGGFAGRQPAPTDDAQWPGGATVSPAARG